MTHVKRTKESQARLSRKAEWMNQSAKGVHCVSHAHLQQKFTFMPQRYATKCRHKESKFISRIRKLFGKLFGLNQSTPMSAFLLAKYQFDEARFHVFTCSMTSRSQKMCRVHRKRCNNLNWVLLTHLIKSFSSELFTIKPVAAVDKERLIDEGWPRWHSAVAESELLFSFFWHWKNHEKVNFWVATHSTAFVNYPNLGVAEKHISALLHIRTKVCSTISSSLKWNTTDF